jgi:ABC-type amino acid transport substrate-binding protein
MDGELGGLYAPRLFPRAKLNLLSLGTIPPQMFLELHSRKADFVILSRLAANAYLKQNPGKLKQVTKESLAKPSVRLFYPIGAYDVKANIDAVLDELQQERIIEKLLDKHGLFFKG